MSWITRCITTCRWSCVWDELFLVSNVYDYDYAYALCSCSECISSVSGSHLYIQEQFTYNDNSVSSKYRISFYIIIHAYLSLIYNPITAVLLLCIPASRRCHRPEFFPLPLFLLPPTSTSPLLPHFNPPPPQKSSSPLLVRRCSPSFAGIDLSSISKFNWIANPDNQKTRCHLCFFVCGPFRAPLRQTNTNSSPRIAQKERRPLESVSFPLLLSRYCAPAVPLRSSLRFGCLDLFAPSNHHGPLVCCFATPRKEAGHFCVFPANTRSLERIEYRDWNFARFRCVESRYSKWQRLHNLLVGFTFAAGFFGLHDVIACSGSLPLLT